MKLLLVDDEEYVIESIKRNLDLTETGVNEVYTAFSVQQAKNIMGMVDIDIVISDIVMPGGTGFDFVEWVRKEELKVQVIFLTSYEKCAERRLLRGKILRNGSTASAAIRTGTLFPADLSDAGNKEQ